MTGLTVSNVAPTADAGDDQTVDEGDTVSFSGSFTDPGAGDTHTIDWGFGDGATATGTLTPTYAYFEEGVYTVTLTVEDDDGGVGSDTLQITVKKIEATIIIKPETFNLNDKGKFTAFITLPDGYSVGNIEVSTVICEGAPAVKGIVDTDEDRYLAKFEREDLRADLPLGDEVSMTVTGKVLYSGGYADFEGVDLISVIDEGKGNDGNDDGNGKGMK